MALQIWMLAPLTLLVMTQIDARAEMTSSDSDRSETVIPLSEREANQISLERVIILRVPRSDEVPPSGESNMRGASNVDCIPADSLVGVKPARSGALDLITKRGTYRAKMPKGCDARQFYSGFYLEQPDDGRLCSDREELHSRSGVTCQIQSMHALSR